MSLFLHENHELIVLLINTLQKVCVWAFFCNYNDLRFITVFELSNYSHPFSSNKQILIMQNNLHIHVAY